ncbi:MAG: universal stress protein [Burkholderiales bacterium]|nr:MAG: universal stress protein [Burkholderiales bacterium]
MKILLAVDGSDHSDHATSKLIELVGRFREPPHIHVLTVHQPVVHLGITGMVLTDAMLDEFYQEEGKKALDSAVRMLQKAGLIFATHIEVGSVAQAIVEKAREIDADYVYMGTRGKTALSNALLGSVVTRVLHLAHGIPVILVQ